MRSAFSSVMICCTCIAATGLGQDTTAVEARARLLAPFLGSQTFALTRVDLTQLDVEGVFRRLAELQETKQPDPDNGSRAWERFVTALRKAGARDIYVLFDLSDLPADYPPVIVPLSSGADETALTNLLSGKTARQLPPSMMNWFRGNSCIKLHGALVSGSASVCDRLKTLQPLANPYLASACEAAGSAPGQVFFLPSKDVLRVADETAAAFAPARDPATPKVFRTGFHWGVATANRGTGLSLTIQSEDAAAAGQLHDLFATLLKALAADPSVQQMYPAWDRLAAQLTPRVSGDRLRLEIGNDLMKAAVGPALRRAHYLVNWSVVAGKLREIGLALHGYHDTKAAFPAAAITDKSGKRLLSWRVAILPYLEQRQLYNEFHLNEPWDSEHNKKLIARMPEVFALTAQLASQGKTTYLGVAGEKAMFPPDNKPLTIRDVTDGTAWTTWVVEVDDAHAVVWTKPEDFDYDPNNPSAGLLGHFPRGFPALFVDGSARLLPAGIDSKTLNALFTRNGGEVIREMP